MSITSVAGDDVTIDLREMYRVLRHRLKTVVGTLAGGAGLVLVYLLLTTPLYTATTEIRIDPGRKSPIGDSLLPGIGNDTAAIESEVRLLRSTSIAYRVIDKLDLSKDQEFAKKPSFPLFATLADLIGFSGSKAAEGSATERSDNLNELTRQFADRLDVKRQGLTYVIAVSFTSQDPRKAAKIANQIAGSYFVDQLDARFEATKRANGWLSERLAKLRATVQASEQAVELYRARHNLVGDSANTPFDSQLLKLNEELILSRVQMNEHLAHLEQAREVIAAKGKLISIDAVTRSETIKNLQSELAKVAGKLAELSTRFTARHPKVLNVRGERRDLLRQMSQEARRIVRNLENEYRIAQRRVSSIEKSLLVLQDKTKGARSASIRLRELEREAAANRAIYEAFLGKFKETSEQETLRTNDARVITVATPPPRASYPKKKLTLFLALIGFSAFGIGLAFLLEHLDNSFKTGEQVEEVLKLAYLASVPKLLDDELKADNGQPIPLMRYVGAKPLSAYAEAMRNIKVGIQLFNVADPPKVVLITSSVPNEGKSTLAANFAQHAVSAGQRVLLIDCDLRNPSLATELGHKGRMAGLVELLAGQADAQQVLLRESGGFDFIQTCYVPQNSEEILGSASMKRLLDEFRQHYDLIILDAMPIVPVVDTQVLVKSVDAIILAIEWDQTPRDLVVSALKKLNAPPEKLAGVVLNKVDMARLAAYGGYGYGYYHKKYGTYYSAGGREG